MDFSVPREPTISNISLKTYILLTLINSIIIYIMQYINSTI